MTLCEQAGLTRKGVTGCPWVSEFTKAEVSSDVFFKYVWDFLIKWYAFIYSFLYLWLYRLFYGLDGFC